MYSVVTFVATAIFTMVLKFVFSFPRILDVSGHRADAKPFIPLINTYSRRHSLITLLKIIYLSGIQFI